MPTVRNKLPIWREVNRSDFDNTLASLERIAKQRPLTRADFRAASHAMRRTTDRLEEAGKLGFSYPVV